MKSNIIKKLTSCEDKEAYAYTKKIILESNISNKWYGYFDEFASLLNHPKSLVRNRAISILAANAKWDCENKFASIIDDYLLHVNDKKPITSRQCIKSLIEIGQAKPKLVLKIKRKLKNIDLSQYKDNMQSLIEKDINNTINKLSN